MRGEIQRRADEIAGRPVDIILPPSAGKRQIRALVKSFGLPAADVDEMRQRIIDMLNTRRDVE